VLTPLKTIIHVLLFEEPKNIWVFQKATHSSIILAQGQAQQLAFEVVMLEKNEERKQSLLKEVGTLLQGTPQGLDTKSREGFQPVFSAFKTFLTNLTL